MFYTCNEITLKLSSAAVVRYLEGRAHVADIPAIARSSQFSGYNQQRTAETIHDAEKRHGQLTRMILVPPSLLSAAFLHL